MTDTSDRAGPPDGAAPGAASPLDLVTEDEIRALLAPLDGAGAREDAPVVVVADGLDEQDRIVGFLRREGVATVAARDGYVALDLLRVGRFRALVVAAGGLPADAGAFFARVRALDASIPVCLIRGPGEVDSAGEAHETVRPLTEDALGRILPLLRSPATTAEDGLTEPGRPVSRGLRDPVPGGGDSRTADGLGATKAALEARLAGGTVHDGLRRWARTSASVEGFVELREERDRTRVEAVGPEARERREMVLLLLGRLAEGADGDGRPRCLGPFTIFPDRENPADAVLALRHGDEGRAKTFLADVSPLIPLLAQIEREAEAAPPEARSRFLSFLESRMRAVERVGGRLGVLLVEGGASPRDLAAGLRQILRGGDWVEPVGSAVYVVLDQPSPEVFEALGGRLRGLPEADRLHVAALGWTPEDGGAAEFLARAERLLREGRRGEAPEGEAGREPPG